MKKVAIFVDWDNLRGTIAAIQRRKKFHKFNFNDPKHLSAMFRAFLDEDEEIYRIYFYTAPMLDAQTIERKIRKTHEKRKFASWKTTKKGLAYKRKVELSNRFLEAIVKEDHVALRLGKLSFRGLKSNSYPDTVQKEVDMLFGLDISHVAYFRLADKAMLFSRDTDSVPAMKIARTQGMEVVLPVFEEDGYVPDKLIKHCDIVRKRSLVKVYVQNILKSP